jgi:hypothetical protein
MSTPETMEQSLSTQRLPLRPLRWLLVLDAVVLFLLGAALIFAPKQVEAAFGFANLPDGVSYIVGLWGCVLATLGIGYFVAASDPLRHVVWVQVGIARGALECIAGGIYLARGVVTWHQAGFGIIVAALITTGYLAWYPRPPRVVPANEPTR